MGLIRNKWLWLSAAGALLSGSLLLVAVGYVGLVVYTGLATGTPVVGALLDVAGPLLAGVAVLIAVLIASVVGLLWTVAHNASVPRSARAAALVERVEREYTPLGSIGIADALRPPEPSADERAERALADLKEQYVSGEITEAEFERRVDRLVAADSIDEARAARERTRVVEDEPGRH